MCVLIMIYIYTKGNFCHVFILIDASLHVESVVLMTRCGGQA